MLTSVDIENHVSDEEAIALVEMRLDDAARRRIDMHLDGCEPCRELIAAMAMAGGPDGDDPQLDHAHALDTSATHDLDTEATHMYRARPPMSARGAPLERGDMVAHFRVMRRLGRGAMGEVYLARDTMLGRRVALKMIAPDLVGSERAMRRFLFEARATARFNHPNIVTIHAVGEHGDRPYVALEYVEGENLRERSKREPPPIRETLRIGLAVAEALAEAHAMGILHRDLKPANIIIGDDGRVRLLDFGLAKAVQAIDEEDPPTTGSSSSTWLVGTPRYMAPEQWQAADVGGAADVWALGAILYELCSGGVKPFDAATTVDLLREVCSDKKAAPLSSICEVPQKLSQLVAECLAKVAEDRPSADEVADALRDILYPERPSLTVSEGPFRGLLPFTERHASFFFGRDPDIAACMERLRIQPVLPLLGPSGSGKTSFVQAGVIPRLREQGGWMVLHLRPGPRPFEALATRLQRGDTGTASALESGQFAPMTDVSARAEALRRTPRKLSVALRELAETQSAKVLLFVDQLEEVFTLVGDEEQALFLEAICSAADDVDDPVRVILALRHDFIDRLRTDGELGRHLSHVLLLKAPDAEALREILVEPVERAGYAYEDADLVDQMITAVVGEPACLPLLQFASARLWEERDESRRLLRRSDYQAMGGVGGALAQHADSILGHLPTGQQKTARTLLLRLVTPERTRRIVPKRQALDGLGSDSEVVLKQLTEARLVSVTKVRSGDDPMLELAHGSLIHNWRTLSEWVAHSEDELRLLGEAVQAADLWDKRGRRSDELWRAEALRDADRALHQTTTPVPKPVARFLAASRAMERRRTLLKRLGAGAVTAVVAILITVGVVVSIMVSRSSRDAEGARREALERERLAREESARLLVQGGRQAFAEGHPLDARAQVRTALELHDSAAARALWHQLNHDPLVFRRRIGGIIHGIAFSPDGETIAVAGHEGRLYLIDATTGASRSLEGRGDALSALAYTADGTTVVTGDLEGQLTSWDVGTGVPRTLGHAGTASIWGLALSPDGKTVTVAGPMGLRLIDLENGSEQMSLSQAEELAVGYALGGTVIASGGAGGELRIFDATSGAVLHSLALGDAVQAIAVTSDGRRVAAASRSGRIVVVDAVEGAVVRDVQRPSGAARTLAFDAKGARMSAGGLDGTADVYDVETGARQASYSFPGAISAAAFDPDGDTLALAGDDQLDVLSLETRSQARYSGHDGPANDARFSPDGKSIASAGADGTVRVWDRERGNVRQVLSSHGDQLAHLCYSPDGELLAAGGSHGTVLLSRLKSGASHLLLGGHEDGVSGLAFSPDGTLLASGGGDQTVRLWDPSSGAEVKVMRGHTGAITSLGFTPDGSSLVTSSSDRTIGVWALADGKPEFFEGHQGGVSSIAVSPDGQHLVSAGNDHTIRLWQLGADGPDLRSSVIDDSAGTVDALAFHPDGATVGVARSDGVVHIVTTAVASDLAKLQGHEGEVHSIAFDATGSFAASAGEDGTVRVWDVARRRAWWRGVALLPGAPPLVLSHRGWEDASAGERVEPSGGWASELAAHALFAAQAAPDAPLCAMTDAGEVELWDVAEDTRVAHFAVDVEQLLALPQGCAARSVGAVHLLTLDGEHRELAIGNAPLVLGRADDHLLVATKHDVVVFGDAGERLASYAHDRESVSAVAQIGAELVIGSAARNITLVSTTPAAPKSLARFSRPSASAPTMIVPGPNGTLIAGYSDGTVALFDTLDGALLLRDRLHGRVHDVLLDEDVLYALTDLGDTLRWDLGVLTADYCTVLADVWEHVPVAWVGEAMPREPPEAHPCR